MDSWWWPTILSVTHDHFCHRVLLVKFYDDNLSGACVFCVFLYIVNVIERLISGCGFSWPHVPLSNTFSFLHRETRTAESSVFKDKVWINACWMGRQNRDWKGHGVHENTAQALKITSLNTSKLLSCSKTELLSHCTIFSLIKVNNCSHEKKKIHIRWTNFLFRRWFFRGQTCSYVTFRARVCLPWAESW